MLSETIAQLIVNVSTDDMKDFERAVSLEAQRTSGSPSHGEVLRACVQAYLDKHDPIRKAERIRTKYSVRTERTSKTNPIPVVYGKRTALPAETEHALNLRDRGKCTWLNSDGDRCNDDRWVHTHHIIPVSHGGSNELANLTTLCSFHHDLVHQLALPGFSEAVVRLVPTVAALPAPRRPS
jgi:5-methylcytosine-specific restriction endonuclease McrA